MLKINENPYLHAGEMPENIYDIKGDYSVTALQRDFNFLFSLTEEDYHIHFLINKWNTLLIGVLNSWQSSTERVLPLFKLRFREKLYINNIPEEITNKKLLQTDRIVLKKDLRNYSISYKVYNKLTEHNYAIISDNTHYEPARGLWLKLARNSNSNYRVILCDTDHGVIKDSDGNTLCYNGTNYPLEQLWTSGSDYSGHYIVLIYY